MHPLIYLIYQLLSLYGWVLIIYIMITWLIHFEIINRRQVFVFKVMDVLTRLVEPALRKIRSYLPDFGGIDLSPIVLFILLNFLQYTITYYSA